MDGKVIMLPWYYKIQKYNEFWRMSPGIKKYKIYFFEKEEHENSCKNKFPITLSDNTKLTKEQFIEIIKEAVDQLNKLNLDISFIYDGHDITQEDSHAFNIKDNQCSIVYYWKFKLGGLSGPLSKDDFGIKMYLGNYIKKSYYVAALRHEITHALGFAHKDEYYKWLITHPVITGLNNQGEFTEDTINGFKIVYNAKAKFNVKGFVITTPLKEGNIFLIDWISRQVLYQSPIDSTGYFEFRLDKPINKFLILAISKTETGKYIYNKIWKIPTAMGFFNRKFYYPAIRLENITDNIETIIDKVGLK